MKGSSSAQARKFTPYARLLRAAHLIRCRPTGRVGLPVAGSAHRAARQDAADAYPVAATGAAKFNLLGRAARNGRPGLITRREILAGFARGTNRPAIRVGGS